MILREKPELSFEVLFASLAFCLYRRFDGVISMTDQEKK
jgi:hypothetical protein